MAESDDLLQPNVDRPIRPGEMFLPQEGFRYPNPQLLRRSAKTKAATLLPELEQNFQYALDVMPMSRAGFGQGTRIRLDPELSVLESSITPWFGRIDSPEYMDALKRHRVELERAVAAMPAAKARHAREFEVQVSNIGHALRRFETQGLGTTIKMGLASPNVATSELNVRDAHMFLSYLMGRNLPPESASMDMAAGRAKRAVQRHAARIGMQSLNLESPHIAGASLPEHVRGLELAFGTKGQGNLLAGLGLQTEKDVTGAFFQEQVINRGQELNPFSRRLVENVMKDRQRVEQSARRLAKAVGSNAKFNEASVAYRNALEDFLDEIFNRPPPAHEGPGLVIPSYNIPRSSFKAAVDVSFQKSYREPMEPFGRQHLQATKRELRQRVLDVYSDVRDPRLEYIRERMKDIDRGVDEYLKVWVKKQKTFQAARAPSRATVAAEGGSRSMVNPVTKVASEAVPTRPVNLKRLEEGTAQVLKQLGRTAPKVPMFLVAALAAGLAVSGFTRSEDGEA